MRSMTGFGVGVASLGAGRLTLEARSINHKHLDLRVRLPRELGDHALFLEGAARARLQRGRFELSVHLEGVAPARVALDPERARDALSALRALATEHGAAEVPLTLLAGVPDLWVVYERLDPETVRTALSGALRGALDALDAMRGTEGAALCDDLSARLRACRAAVERLQSDAGGMVDRARERLRKRAQRLSEGLSGVDTARLEHEVCLAAEHGDVSEELTRLASHLAQLQKLLESTEPCGRRMDFLLQEMGREANTLGSKATDPEVTVVVVELKAEIERLREQAQNIE